MPTKPPAARLTCKAEPLSPGASATDRQAGDYVTALVEAGRDCRSQLNWVRDFYSGLEG
jgi:hypothetical protein